jgi:hypothetical protein
VIWAYLLDAANWLLARAIDSATAGREVLPPAAAWFGLALVVAAPVAVSWLWVSARRRDRVEPPPRDLLETDPWLASNRLNAAAEPARYQGRRRLGRRRVVPAHPARAADVDMTVPIVVAPVDQTQVFYVVEPVDADGVR